VNIECKSIRGAVLSDQMKSLDWKERQAESIEKADIDVLEEVIGKLKALVIE
jgi:mRNA-degrading endonuclease toxin of MazEF toxin-antitoxin module